MSVDEDEELPDVGALMANVAVDSLPTGSELSDEAFNGGIDLLIGVVKAHLPDKKLLLASTLLHTGKQKAGGYTKAKNWLKKHVRAQQVILIPVNVLDGVRHWILCYLDTRAGTYGVYDSMQRPANYKHIADEWLRVFVDVTQQSLTLFYPDGYNQVNGNDCGVCTLLNVLRIVKSLLDANPLAGTLTSLWKGTGTVCPDEFVDHIHRNREIRDLYQQDGQQGDVAMAYRKIVEHYLVRGTVFDVNIRGVILCGSCSKSVLIRDEAECALTVSVEKGARNLQYLLSRHFRSEKMDDP